MSRLAVHPDPRVRHLLAYNHPLAPPELLLEAFIAGPRQRLYLLTPGLTFECRLRRPCRSEAVGAILATHGSTGLHLFG